MKKSVLAVLAASVVLSVFLLTLGGDPERGMDTITSEDYARRIGIIAHDSMGGRDTPSPGLDATALWIASEFERLGLRGGARDGGFIQRYPLTLTTVDVEASALSAAGGERLAFGPDVLPFRAPADGEVTGGLVLASGVAEGREIDPAAVAGKHVAVLLPEEAPASRRSRYALLGAVSRAGAASVLVVDESSDDAWAAEVRGGLEPRVGRADPSARAGSDPFAPMLQVRASALDRLLAGSGTSVDAMRSAGESLRLQEVPGLALTLTMRVQTSDASAPNVVGVLDGSDPELADEFVVFSAHMDHVGTDVPDENGDSIFNGADDDASGTVAVVEIAEAMASLEVPPRRSAIFLLVSGEEKGLWGSEYYAENPTVPAGKMVANLNLDMVGRNWPDTIVAIGKEHSDLGETLERVNAAHPELGMTAIDDLWPEQSFYTRSDHYNFARKGVPILFFFNGTHPDYHGRDDEPDRIDVDKAARITKLVFLLGAEIADRDERPEWNPESYREIVLEPGTR